MEKFYIVTNADFLNEIKDYNVHDEERRKLINARMECHGSPEK